jgi:clan AA aspartic protease (TIGR02281 family)
MARQAEKLTAILALILLVAPQALAEEAGSTAAMKPVGWRFAVPVALNGRLEKELIIDTGSTFTVISTAAARALGIGDLSHAPRYPINAAGGMTWVRLVILDKVSAAGQTAINVEGAVADMPSFNGADGLLGRSFLDRYTFRMEGAGKTFSLFPPGNGPLYGGRSQGWWKTQAQGLSRQARLFRAMELGAERSTSPTDAQDWPPGKLTKEDVARLSIYFGRLLENLKNEAMAVSVPEEWINPPPPKGE